jgi:DsbC/DsbD-like thiol-disulfide interchange protein
MRYFITFLSYIISFFIAFSNHAYADQGNVLKVNGAKLTLLGPGGGPVTGAEFMLGLKIELEPGWKTYWMTPGPTGLAPHIEIIAQPIDKTGRTAPHSGSKSDRFEVLFPVPVRLPEGDIGYEREVILPLQLILTDPDISHSIKVVGTIGLCETLCVPVDVSLVLHHDPKGRPQWQNRHAIQQALEKVPEEKGNLSFLVKAFREENNLILQHHSAEIEDIFLIDREEAWSPLELSKQRSVDQTRVYQALWRKKNAHNKPGKVPIVVKRGSGLSSLQGYVVMNAD